MPNAAIRPRASAIPACVILLLAAPAYAAMLWSARALAGLEGADKGMASLGALAALVVLWLLLAAMLLLGGARGWMPRWARLAVCVLVPVSGGAAFQLIALVGGLGGVPPWAFAALALLPPVLACYAFWAHFPRLHPVLPPTPVSLGLLGAVLLLCIAPMTAVPRILPAALSSLPALVLAEPAPPLVPASREAAPPVATSEPRGDFATRLTELTPDSPLAAFLPYLAAGGDLRRQALERARLLPNRQSDAETLLGEGQLAALADLSRLDLEPTPALCAAFGTQLRREAEADRGKEGFGVVADGIETHLETMNWLTGAGCGLTDALAAVSATAAAYPESPERTRLLAALASMMAAERPDLAADPSRCIAAADAIPDRIVADCNAVIRTGRAGFGRLAAALANRGRALFVLGRADDAAGDFARARALRPEDGAALLWRFLAERRAGRFQIAAARADGLTLDRTAWPGPAVSVFLGEHDIAWGLAAARAGDVQARGRQLCEAQLFLGAKAALERQAPRARDLLRRAVAECQAGSIEAAAAKSELARLGR